MGQRTQPGSAKKAPRALEPSGAEAEDRHGGRRHLQAAWNPTRRFRVKPEADLSIRAQPFW
jgi:hypothetical protein